MSDLRCCISLRTEVPTITLPSMPLLKSFSLNVLLRTVAVLARFENTSTFLGPPLPFTKPVLMWYESIFHVVSVLVAIFAVPNTKPKRGSCPGVAPRWPKWPYPFNAPFAPLFASNGTGFVIISSKEGLYKRWWRLECSFSPSFAASAASWSFNLSVSGVNRYWRANWSAVATNRNAISFLFNFTAAENCLSISSIITEGADEMLATRSYSFSIWPISDCTFITLWVVTAQLALTDARFFSSGCFIG